MPELTPAAAEPVRILLPDHPDLVLSGAIDFAADLRRSGDPATYAPGEEPWTLPAQLRDPGLQAALAEILDRRWLRHVGRYGDGEDTAIHLSTAGLDDAGVTPGEVGHMGVYLATATAQQLRLLTAADDLMTTALTTPHSERTPQQRQVVEYLDEVLDFEQEGDISYSAWRTALRLFGVATATEPVTEHRPDRLLDLYGTLVRQPDITGTSPAVDTATLLARIDFAGGGEVLLDAGESDALRRLVVEWHVAIYADQANTGSALLTSFLY